MLIDEEIINIDSSLNKFRKECRLLDRKIRTKEKKLDKLSCYYRSVINELIMFRTELGIKQDKIDHLLMRRVSKIRVRDNERKL